MSRGPVLVMVIIVLFHFIFGELISLSGFFVVLFYLIYVESSPVMQLMDVTAYLFLTLVAVFFVI